MAPVIQLQPVLQYSREAGKVQQKRDSARGVLVVPGKRQGPSSPSPQTTPASAAQATTSASPSSSIQFAVASQRSSSTSVPDTSSTPLLSTSSFGTSELSTSRSLSSPNPTTPPYPSSDQTAPPSEHTKTIVFGVLGGILGLLLLGLIAFRLLPRYQQSKSRKHPHYEPSWKKWNSGTYSPLDGNMTFSNVDAQEKVTHNNGVPYTWWQKFGFSAASEVRKPEGKRKKSGTLYKVKNLKPDEDFDIDSCTLPK